MAGKFAIYAGDILQSLAPFTQIESGDHREVEKEGKKHSRVMILPRLGKDASFMSMKQEDTHPPSWVDYEDGIWPVSRLSRSSVAREWYRDINLFVKAVRFAAPP